MVAKADKVKHTSSYTLTNTTKKSITSLMRTTFKNCKRSHGQIPKTYHQDSTTQRPYHQYETKEVLHPEETPTPRPKSPDQTI